MYRAKLTKETTPKQAYKMIEEASLAGSFPSAVAGESPLCRYRSHNGERACGFGIFIPDELYNPSFDVNHSENSLLNIFNKVCKDFPDWFNIQFASDIQFAHDYMPMNETWDHARFMEKVAKAFQAAKLDIN